MLITILLYEKKPSFINHLNKIKDQLPILVYMAEDKDTVLTHLKTKEVDLIIVDPDQDFDAIFRQIVGVIKKFRQIKPMICLLDKGVIKSSLLNSIDGLFSEKDSPERVLIQIRSLFEKKKRGLELESRTEEFNDTQYHLRQQLVIQQTIYEAAKLMNSTIALDEVLFEILDILSGIMEVKTICILLVDEVSQNWIVRASFPDEKLIGTSVSDISEILYRMSCAEDHIFQCDLDHIQYPLPTDQDFSNAALMGIPLLSRDQFIGTILVTDDKDQLSRDRRDVNILIDMASQISNAVRNAGLYSKVEELSIQDGLTKLYNRIYLQKTMDEEFKKSKQYQYSISIALLDIDFFKHINDTYGHQIGDEVLKLTADTLRTTIRKTDIAVRFGGEEMIGFLVGASANDAYVISEKIRKQISEIELYAVQVESDTGEQKHMLVQKESSGALNLLLFPFTAAEQSVPKHWLNRICAHFEGQSSDLDISQVKVTASVGVASYPENFDHKGAASLLDSTDEKDLLIYMADKALYKAKKNGRNRTLTYQECKRSVPSLDVQKSENELIMSLLEKLKVRDKETYLHCLRVSQIAYLLGRELDISTEDLMIVRFGGALHDIGKLFIEDAVLLKPDRFTDEEYEIMKSHTTKGADYIEQNPLLHKYINAIRYHHEQWCGKGYPTGIAQTRIPIEARILAVADSFDAMTADRRYQESAFEYDKIALNELKKNREIMYDATIVDAFIRIFDEIKMICEKATPPVIYKQ